MSAGAPLSQGREHLAALKRALDNLEAEVGRVDAWSRHLAEILVGGGRLFTSAALEK